MLIRSGINDMIDCYPFEGHHAVVANGNRHGWGVSGVGGRGGP